MSDQTADMLVAVHQGYVPATELGTAQARIAELEGERNEALAWVEHWKKYQQEQKRRKRAVSALYGQSLKRIAELTTALSHIIRVLGPTPCRCQGQQEEVAQALEIARAALGEAAGDER